MKKTTELTAREELLSLKKSIELTEKKISFTNEPKLLDALSFELLSLRSRMGYLIDCAKQDI
ncbi:MAG: hypothetical protein IJ408_06345 [Clostridia bacterium]|nr:hypothetical protein [Clostridia bacterium]